MIETNVFRQLEMAVRIDCERVHKRHREKLLKSMHESVKLLKIMKDNE